MNKVYYFCRIQKKDVSSSYARIRGLKRIIDPSLKCDCEIIDFGIEYKNGQKSNNKIISLFQIFWTRVANEHRLKKFIKTHEKADVIFTHFLMVGSMKWLKKYCERNRIPLVCDYCEWNSAKEKRMGIFSTSLRRNIYSITKWMDPSLNAIGISKYFTNYFASKNINTIRIPNLLDTDSYSLRTKEPTSDLNLLFVGNRARKDFLSLLVDAIAGMKEEEKKRIHLVVIGSDTSSKSISPVNQKNLKAIRSCLTIYDKLPYREFEKLYDDCDFSFFIYSETLQYAKALFPTKLSDSFIHSRPVMSNIVNDIGLYLTNKENSIIIAHDTVEDVQKALRDALALTIEEKKQMQVRAFEDGKRFFDYKDYIEPFTIFINKVLQKRDTK